jgi:ribosomal 50S subunit-associated protein YjgA (DUF615 family)
MNILKRFSISLLTLMLFSGVALVAPASARDGSASGSGDKNEVATSSDSSSTSNDSTATTDETTSSNDLTEQFKEQAHAKLQTTRQNGKQHTEAERAKACTARKTELTRRMSQAVTQAKKHKAVFDNIYTKVKGFYVTKQLNVTNYDTLTAAVDKAQASAQTNIDALQSLNVSVDCTSQTVADSVSAFQQAVGTTRDSLKSYRAALVDLINSLKGASTGTTDNSTTNSTSH